MNRVPANALHEAYDLVYAALDLLIPIPNAITHNVALTLDEALNSMRDALSELGE